MKLFLKLKHWQAFALVVFAPIVLLILSFGVMVSQQNPGIVIFVFPVIVLMYMGFFFGWFLAIGTILNRELPIEIRLNIRLFKVFMIIPICYISLLAIAIWLVTQSFLVVDSTSNFVFTIVIIPAHLFSLACIIYCFYFTAKTLKTFELKRVTHFSDFIGEFFMIWFFPFGIWIIQPRLNKIAESLD